MSDSYDPRTAAHQTPLSMEFPRGGYRGVLPFPSLGDLPSSGTEPASPILQVDSLPLSHQESPKSTLFQLKRREMPVTQINQCTRAQEDGLGPLGRTLGIVLNTGSNREIFVFFLTLVKYFHH